jgi:hypothetical protein
MKIYFASMESSVHEQEHRVYRTIDNALKYIYESMKSLSLEVTENSGFFDTENIREYFTEEYIKDFSGRINARNIYGEFSMSKAFDKYQYIYIPSDNLLKSEHMSNILIVCELEVLELLD